MTITPMQAVLAIGFCAIILTFWRAHKSLNSFNALDLVMENGKVSRIALAFMLVLAVTTWIMVDQQIKGRMTAEIFGLYGTMWVVPLVAKLVFNKNDIAGMTLTSTTVVTETKPAPEPEKAA